MGLMRRKHARPYDFDALATYNSEVARGIAHTPEWELEMSAAQERYNELQRQWTEISSLTTRKEVTMPKQIVPQISQTLAHAYDITQRELAKDQAMTSQVWDEALTQLQGFDPSDATFRQWIEAHASVSILEQVLTSVPGPAGFFNGNQQQL